MNDKKIGVLIADDEERICRLITALGEWEALGMEVIGTAENGPEALELLEEKPVDILITDIRMPGITGIELIERAKAASPGTRFIIISGYAEFSYAQQALHNGVEDYLLKPINKDQLNEALRKIRTKLVGEEARELEYKRREELIKTRSTELRGAFIRDLLMNPDIRLTKEEMAEKYDIKVREDRFRFFCVKLCIMDGNKEANAGEAFLWEKVRYLLNEELKGSCENYEMLLQGRCLYGLLNYSEEKSEEVRKGLRDALNQFGSLKGIFRSGRLFMATGASAKHPEELGRSLTLAKRAVDERFIKGEGKLLELKNDKSALFEKKLLDQYSRRLSLALESYDTEMLLQAVEVLKEETSETEGVCGYEMHELVRQAGNMLALRLELSDGIDRVARFYEDCENCGSMDSLFEELKRFATDSLQAVRELKEDEPLRAVRQAKKYLMNHYAEQLTLEGVSEQLGLSAPYFSSLFKRETGTGFARYLMGLRIEAAKELLRESNLSVAEVCRRVGYYDVKHFTRNFEQSVGIKPAVYRKLYG